jgi:hypothetical protein
MTDSNLSFETAFASPIVAGFLPDSERLNNALRDLFLAREAEGLRKKDKTPTVQVNIFESEFDLFSWPDAPVRELRSFCMSALSEAVGRLNNYSADEIRRLRIQADCWFHITRYGGYIGNHNHPMASWSGVYCVAAGEQPPEHPDSGVLRFPDGRPYANMYLDPGNARIGRPFSSGSVNYKLEGGHLVLFPGYLAHEVTPFFGGDERITVAFNCRFLS